MAKETGKSKTGKPTDDEIAARKAAKSAGKGDKGDKGEALATAKEVPPARLRVAYGTKVVPAMTEKFGYKNKLAVPRLSKIVISMGVGT